MVIIIVILTILGSFLIGIAYSEDAQAAGNAFKITWEHPELDTEGNVEDVSRITGYDIWYTYEDGDRQYAKWFPMDSPDDVLEYDFPFQEQGEYCFQLATVTKDDGKSDLSPAVCANTEVVEPMPNPGKPQPPITITIIITGTSNVEVKTEIDDATH